MKSKVLKFLFVAAIVALVSVIAVLADDGELARKAMSPAPAMRRPFRQATSPRRNTPSST